MLLTLYIDAPVFGIKTESLKGALLAKSLRLVNEFVSSIVAGTRVALGVLV